MIMDDYERSKKVFKMADNSKSDISCSPKQSEGHPKSDDLTDKDGLHMLHIREALDKTLKKCLESARYNVFAKHYKFVKEKALRSIVSQFVENLQSSIQTELDLMIKEEGLVALFNELDQLIEDTPTDREGPAWRPSGDPNSDVINHRMQPKLKEKERLVKLLEQCEVENKRLQEALKPRKRQLADTQQKLNKRFKAFEDAAKACDKIPMKEIQESVKHLSQM
ncbi:polyamine-modulated factor 1-like [Anneissia japonica]|uniref:polyamine-modulated factor 1-like n=1 Tax=Anneissia japonica TaxID=1529436 RepID=UPI0014258154|nr:polyamine-modulated factor 1-like [Anneissia japonica]XP_033121787.1 polyamine-modulated factor 1-like [Anneissia japonica]